MIFKMMCENLAAIIRAVKEDEVSQKMIREFSLAGKKPQ
jgi:hypothetical protein